MKKCSKCGEIKDETEFYKCRSNKDKLQGSCKKCWSKRKKEYYKNNLEYFREKNKEWKESNPEKVKEKKKRWIKNNPEKVREYNKKYRKNNPEKYKETRRKYYKKLSKMSSYKINRTIRNGIWKALKGSKNGKHWEDLVGYTLEDLMEHLENQFEDWMNWENHGVYKDGELRWQIDHIRPVSSFNFTSAEDKEVKECWSLDNLQPLEVIENIKKGNETLLDNDDKKEDSEVDDKPPTK
jgi:hypothetical protein